MLPPCDRPLLHILHKTIIPSLP